MTMTASTTSTIDALLRDGWADHADRPEDVAARLADGIGGVASVAEVRPFAGLATHVFGEHLGRWQEGVTLLRALRALPVAATDGDAAAAIERSIAVLRYAEGDASVLEPFASADRASVLASASAALVGQRQTQRGIAAFRAALAIAGGGLPAGSPAVRALAVAGNNLASTLEDKHDRDAVETTAMVEAARVGLRFWQRAGTWLEEERAEYRLARCLLAAGELREAVASAARCLEICEANAADAFERFFAHAVLARTQRAAGDAAASEAARRAAHAAYDALDPSDRSACEVDLRALDEAAAAEPRPLLD